MNRARIALLGAILVAGCTHSDRAVGDAALDTDKDGSSLDVEHISDRGRFDGSGRQDGRVADGPGAESGLPDAATADGPAVDSIVADTLAPDTLAPDTLAPDTYSPPPPCELAEPGAAVWDCTFNVAPGCSSATAGAGQVTTDATVKQVGTRSVKIYVNATSGSFGDRVRIQRSGARVWDLSGFTRMRFWARSNVTSSYGWQDLSCGSAVANAYRVNPWIVLRDSAGESVRIYSSTATAFQATRTAWQEFVLPTQSNALGWVVDKAGSAIDYSKISKIEIYVDAWAGEYTLWIDGLTFTNPTTSDQLNDCG